MKNLERAIKNVHSRQQSKSYGLFVKYLRQGLLGLLEAFRD